MVSLGFTVFREAKTLLTKPQDRSSEVETVFGQKLKPLKHKTWIFLSFTIFLTSSHLAKEGHD